MENKIIGAITESSPGLSPGVGGVIDLTFKHLQAYHRTHAAKQAEAVKKPGPEPGIKKEALGALGIGQKVSTAV